MKLEDHLPTPFGRLPDPPQLLGHLPEPPTLKKLPPLLEIPVALPPTATVQVPEVQNEPDLTRRREIAQEVLGQITWVNDSEGDVECPGKNLHTKDSAPSGKAFIDQVPPFHCFHQSCLQIVEATNRILRSRISRAERGLRLGKQTKITLEKIQRHQQDINLAPKIKQWEQQSWEAISRPRSPRSLYENSQTALPNWITRDRCSFLRIFHPDDIIWTGFVSESSSRNFHRVGDTINAKGGRTPYVSTSSYKPRSEKRLKENIKARRFLVVESDELSIGQQVALLINLSREWQLAAVVTTGGKSLHGWFRWRREWNSEMGLRELSARLKAMHCDTAALRPNQIYRLPGILNADTLRFQSLIYLNLNHSYNEY